MLSPEEPLIIHDGELADVCQLLAELGLAFVEAPARAVDLSAYYSASLVIASPPFLLQRLDDPEDKHPARIAVMTSEARTVRKMLARSGVERIVRRPVHPTALRLFVLHSLYRGHEKRSNERVSVGAEVQIRAGWRRRKVLLAEISQRDCRLLTRHSFKMDQKVSLRLPREVTDQKPLSLVGRVVRIGSADLADGTRDVCLIFQHSNAGSASLLAGVIKKHTKGPAIFSGTLAGPAGQTQLPAPAQDEDGTEAAKDPVQVDPKTGETNRRATPRHSFERRVIALGDEAARVLLGRDISLFGMRVDPSPALSLGDKLAIAIHTPGQSTPLVLQAEVDRDDGDRGLLLHFVDVTPEAESLLQHMLAPLTELPEGTGGQTDEDEEPNLIVSEILEHHAEAG